ncbi:MAG: hypothetical protein HYS63_07335 [Methylocystis sp.]|nr:hypothetical protein [Methylocystis sp.]
MSAAGCYGRRAFAVAALAATAVSACAAHAEDPPPAHKQCFTMAQARGKIETHQLADPFKSMREAALRLQGEPLGARLCQLGEGLIYEISLLRRDGHIVKGGRIAAARR